MTFFKDVGFEVCNTPIRSPESNGIAEAFFRNFKRDNGIMYIRIFIRHLIELVLKYH